MRYVARLQGLERVIVPLPGWAAQAQAFVLEHLPGPLMTRDNLASMKVDSVCACPFPAVFGFAPSAMEAIVPEYMAAAGLRGRYAQLPPHREVKMEGLTLVIGNKNYSSWSMRAWVLLAQLGIAFEERKLALRFRRVGRGHRPLVALGPGAGPLARRRGRVGHARHRRDGRGMVPRQGRLARGSRRAGLRALGVGGDARGLSQPALRACP